MKKIGTSVCPRRRFVAAASSRRPALPLLEAKAGSRRYQVPESVGITSARGANKYLLALMGKTHGPDQLEVVA